MKQHRTIGVFLLGCAVICFLIAWERYHSAVQTAQEIARVIKEIEFESVSTPIETIVSGLLGVAMAVAGVVLIMEYIREKNKPDDLLKP
ncbi:hypothetical protein N9B31_02240 [Mariniblastus sp.]|jgi:hypothetical protein|nr:hypothetical protein [Mariniblastus sp.]MDA7902455.1 hypothetical protein [Mariniblastus sp.]MDA7905359.1 hypothetical protein [Mariniblastus sp.]MDA7928868.1 hypothetical protein [Mariniblastus sp.]